MDATICANEGCGNKAFARSLCRKHYRALLAAGGKIPVIKTCTVDGCDEPHDAFGLCRLHYQRKKSGGATKRVPIGTTHTFVELALSSTTADCILWPFKGSIRGYGYFTMDGKVQQVHRYVCRMTHGEPSSAKLHAAHSCGRPGCINPRHLRWATAKENMADRDAHGNAPRGERNAGAKLSEAQVLEIRRSSLHPETLAQHYGVSESAVNAILAKRTWAHV